MTTSKDIRSWNAGGEASQYPPFCINKHRTLILCQTSTQYSWGKQYLVSHVHPGLPSLTCLIGQPDRILDMRQCHHDVTCMSSWLVNHLSVVPSWFPNSQADSYTNREHYAAVFPLNLVAPSHMWNPPRVSFSKATSRLGMRLVTRDHTAIMATSCLQIWLSLERSLLTCDGVSKKQMRTVSLMETTTHFHLIKHL